MRSPTISLITEGPFTGIIGAFQKTIIIVPPLPPTKLVIICEHDRSVTISQREGQKDCRSSTYLRLCNYTCHQVMQRGEPHTKGLNIPDQYQWSLMARALCP